MRGFLATIAGLIAAVAGIYVLERLGHMVYRIDKPDIDPHNIEDLKNIMHKIPMAALVIVIVAHTLGLYLGLLISRMIERSTLMPLFFVSGLIILLSVLNVLMLSHPTWFVVTDIGLMILISSLYIQSRWKS